MPFYDLEAIERARQVDLLTYLQTCEPQELVHVSGNVYCTKTHDSLRISNGNTEFDANYYSWGGARISHILRNPFYKGAHLVFRTHQKGIRSIEIKDTAVITYLPIFQE